MGVLDQITKMRGQGMPEKDIISGLSEQGISPKEINDGLKQAQIKKAVSDFDDEMQPATNIEEEIPAPDEQNPQEYTPQAQGYSNREYAPSEQQYAPQEDYTPQEYAPSEQQYAPQEDYTSYSQAGINTDTIIEIADQIFSDRIRKFQKQEEANSEAIILLQTKLDNGLERLKKIETIIDKLQIAILEKVGSYGQNLEGIKKERSMMQDSFSKMISPSKETRKPISNQEQYPQDETEDIKESLNNISKRR